MHPACPEKLQEGKRGMNMTESKAIKELQDNIDLPYGVTVSDEVSRIAINALENQEKIKEVIENANQWSKEDVIVKAQAFCEIEAIMKE